MIYYIVSGLDWKQGDIISNDTFSSAPHKTFFIEPIPSEYIENVDYNARRETEFDLERIRICKYSQFPSRREAIFLNKTIGDAVKWQSLKSRSEYHIYELIVKECISCCEANYIWYNYCVRLKKNIISEFRNIFSPIPEIDYNCSLKAYWENDQTKSNNCAGGIEVLYVGKLFVSKKIT